MSDTMPEIDRRLRELRKGFDSSFAHPVDLSTTARGDAALCCRVGSQLCALPVSDVSGVFKVQALFPLPARARGFLGIGIFRSAMIPVYDLGNFLGVAPASEQGWSVLLGRSDVVGVKVNAIEGYGAFDRFALSRDRNEESMRYLQGVVHHNAKSYGLIDVRKLHQDLIRRER